MAKLSADHPLLQDIRTELKKHVPDSRGPVADHDLPYRFGSLLLLRESATGPFSYREYVRLLLLRGRVQDARLWGGQYSEDLELHATGWEETVRVHETRSGGSAGNVPEDWAADADLEDYPEAHAPEETWQIAGNE